METLLVLCLLAGALVGGIYLRDPAAPKAPPRNPTPDPQTQPPPSGPRLGVAHRRQLAQQARRLHPGHRHRPGVRLHLHPPGTGRRRRHLARRQPRHAGLGSRTRTARALSYLRPRTARRRMVGALLHRLRHAVTRCRARHLQSVGRRHPALGRSRRHDRAFPALPLPDRHRSRLLHRLRDARHHPGHVALGLGPCAARRLAAVRSAPLLVAHTRRTRPRRHLSHLRLARRYGRPVVAGAGHLRRVLAALRDLRHPPSAPRAAAAERRRLPRPVAH